MSVERATGRETLPPSPETLREQFGTEMAYHAMHEGMQRWGTFPNEQREQRLEDAYGEGMLNRLRGFRQQTAAQVDRAEAILMPAMAAMDDRNDSGAEERLTEILERLRADLPETAGDDADHPYLKTTTVARLQSDPNDPGEVPPHTLYKVDNAAVQRDIDVLAAIRRSGTLTPEQSAEMDGLIGLLNTLRFQDPAVAIQRKADELAGGRTAMDIGGKKMGRALLFAIAATATVVFGAMALVDFIRNKRVSLAPFIWGFAAWFLADPDLTKTFFDGDASLKKDFAEAGNVTRDRTLLSLSKRHGIGGPAWAATVEDIYDGGHGDLHRTAHPTPEAVEEYVSGQPAEVQDGLRAMFGPPTGADNKNDFQRFVAALGAATSDGSKELVLAGVREDYFRNANLDAGTRVTLDRAIHSKDFIRRAS